MSPDRLRVRSGLPEDVLAPAAVERAAAHNPWSLSQFVSSSLRTNKHSQVLLASADELVGFLVYQRIRGEATLINIAVLPDYQGLGGAALLLAALLNGLETVGVRRCLLEVRRSNAPAIALYRRHGFVDDGVRSNYYPTADGREDALLMSRTRLDDE